MQPSVDLSHKSVSLTVIFQGESVIRMSTNVRDNKSVFKPHEIEWTDEKASRLWDFYGSSEDYRSSYFGETAGPHFIRVLKRKGLFRNTHNIVDFSCGTGAIIENLLSFVRKDTHVLGLDSSTSSIEKTISRNSSKSNFYGASKIDGYPTKLGTNSIDLVLLTEVIEHLDDNALTDVLSECYRILAPGGKLIITTPNKEKLATSNVICPECGSIFHRWQHRRHWSKQSIRDALSEHKFNNVQVQSITWGNELIELAFVILRRIDTGLLAISEKS